MLVGQRTGPWTRLSPGFELLDLLQQRYGPIRPLREMGSAPAERFALPDGTVFGIIASTTAPFCQTCDRSRLTADGMWYLCLYARKGIDLRTPLRGGASREEMRAIIQAGWSRRTDRGAEERLGIWARGVLVQIEGLRNDPHLEMHTRGLKTLHPKVVTDPAQLTRRLLAVVSHPPEKGIEQGSPVNLFGSGERIHALQVLMGLFHPLLTHQVFNKAFDHDALDDGNTGQ